MTIKDAELTKKYASILRKTLNQHGKMLTAGISTEGAYGDLFAVMSDTELRNGEGLIDIELEIKDSIIDSIFK